MANKYCNLDGSKKIKDEYKKINVGFDKVEEDTVEMLERLAFKASREELNNGLALKADESRIDEIITTPAVGISEQEILDARHGRPSLGSNIKHLRTELTNYKYDMPTNVKDFGAVGDGETDDRLAIQTAIEYVEERGGTLYFPPGTYALLSFNEEYSSSNLVIRKSPIKLIGAPTYSRLRSETLETDTILLIPNSTRYIQLENLTISGLDCDYNFRADIEYSPYMTIRNCLLTNAKIANAKIATYVSVFDKVMFQLSEGYGLMLQGIDVSICTAITLNSCYVNIAKIAGYSFTNMVYSTVNSCACDSSGIGYLLDNCRGITMSGCGAEQTVQPLRAISFFGLTINSFYTLGCGSTDVDSPTKYLFEFNRGTSCVISGLHLQANKEYNYVLGLTSGNWGSENITVLDGSISRAEIYYVSNYRYNNPISLLVGDKSSKDVYVTLSPGELWDYLKSINGMTINHDILITLSEGDYNITSGNHKLTMLSGSGSLTIIGDPNDREKVNITTNYEGFTIQNNSIPITFKDLTLSNGSSNNGSKIIRVLNADIILDNVLLANPLTVCGSAIVAGNANVILTNNTHTRGTFNFNGNTKVFRNDGGATYSLDKAIAPPSVGYYDRGQIVYSLSPSQDGVVGWICTLHGDSGKVWRGFGNIE